MKSSKRSNINESIEIDKLFHCHLPFAPHSPHSYFSALELVARQIADPQQSGELRSIYTFFRYTHLPPSSLHLSTSLTKSMIQGKWVCQEN